MDLGNSFGFDVNRYELKWLQILLFIRHLGTTSKLHVAPDS